MPCYDISVRNRNFPTDQTVAAGEEFFISYTVEDICGNIDTTAIEITGTNDGVEYCYPNAGKVALDTNSNDFIQGVFIHNTSVITGNNDGYYLHDRQLTTLAAGDKYSLDLAGLNKLGNDPNLYFRVWIDYNQDGDFFDPNEMILDEFSSNGRIQKGTFSVPSDAMTSGRTFTMLRVAARRYTTPEPCGDFEYGEVEDYQIRIFGTNHSRPGLKSDLNKTRPTAQIYPNPATDRIWINTQSRTISEYQLTDITGKIFKMNKADLDGDVGIYELNTADLANGVYVLRMNFEDGSFETNRLIIERK